MQLRRTFTTAVLTAGTIAGPIVLATPPAYAADMPGVTASDATATGDVEPALHFEPPPETPGATSGTSTDEKPPRDT